MRLALTRVQAVDALDSSAAGLRDGWSRVPSPVAMVKGAAMVGTGIVVAGSLFRAARGRSVPVAVPVVNPWYGVALQAVSLLLIPFLHRLITQGKPDFRMPQLPTMPSMPRVEDIPTPTELFFRWLGLQK